MTLSQLAFAVGARGGRAGILTACAWNTASQEVVNWPARSPIRNVAEAARRPRSMGKLRAAWVVPGAVGVRGDTSQVTAAGAVFDHDQGVASPPEHGVHQGDIGRENGVAWAAGNCFPAGPARRGRGSIPASCRICHPVEAAIGWPSLTV